MYEWRGSPFAKATADTSESPPCYEAEKVQQKKLREAHVL